MLRALIVAACCASATAFAPPKSAVAPRKVNTDAPLTKALELRGGGIISKVCISLCGSLAVLQPVLQHTCIR